MKRFLISHAPAGDPDRISARTCGARSDRTRGFHAARDSRRDRRAEIEVSQMQAFTKLPSAWIENEGLKAFRWANGGSDNIAALMTLAVIAHHIDAATGIAHLRYDELSDMASIARAKVSAGLKLLASQDIVELGAAGGVATSSPTT